MDYLRRRFALITSMLLLAGCSFGVVSPSADSIALPLSFEPNRGQAHETAKFLAHGPEGTIFLQEDGVRALLSDGKRFTEFRMRFAPRHSARIEAEGATGGTANYYQGSDRRNWLENIRLYSRVRYKESFPGIDVLFHGRSGRLEYDFEVKPGADSSAIELEFQDGQSIALRADGTLLVTKGESSVTLLKPEAFQMEGDRKAPVQARYKLMDQHHVRFDVGSYDRDRTLIIDPVVSYTRVIGLNNSTTLEAIAADKTGNLFLTGNTTASSYPNTSGSSINVNAGRGPFYVTKLDPTGNTILYSTMMNAGEGRAITLDASGNAYVGGIATDPSFPTTSQSLGVCGQSCNAGFAAKFDTSGKMIYSTLLASGQILPKAIAVTAAGEALLTGFAYDATLQTLNPIQGYTASICTSCSSPFLVKLNSEGTGYEFATFLGDGGGASGIALDPTGNIYLAGIGWVPLKNPLESVGNLFVSEVSADGQTLMASTYFGSIANNNVFFLAGLATASDGSVYAAGSTDAADFPYTLNASRLPQVASGYEAGFFDMFAVKFKAGLTGEAFSTYLGQGFANALVVDSTDHLYVAGSFGPEPLILKNAVTSDNSGGGYIATLDSSGAVTLMTQFGGQNSLEIPTAIAVDGSNNIYIAGIPSTNVVTSRGTVLDTLNVGVDPSYSRQAALGDTVNFVGYSTFAAKIAPINLPQVSLSYWAPFLVLRDAGSADLHLTSVTAGGKAVTTGNCGSTLPAGRSCVLYDSSAITIKSDAQPTSQSYTPGTNPPFGASLPLLLQPPSLYFPPQQVNTASQPQTIAVWNVQPTAQSITSIRTQGGVSQTNNCPDSLAPGANCTITASIALSSAPQGGIIIIDLPSQQTVFTYVDLMATSTSAVSLSMNSANFGNVAVGKSSLVRTIGITNASGETIAAPTASISGDPAFSIVGSTCTSSLLAGASCGIGVRYTPAGNGASAATLSVTSGSGSATVQLAASGALPSAVTVNPLELDFQYMVVGNPSYAQSVTLTNTSSSAVAVTGIQFGLPDYSETDTCQNPMPPAGTCVISVVTTPQNVGDRSSTMTITFDKALTQQLQVKNTQVGYPVGTNPTALDFGDVTAISTDSNPLSIGLTNNLQNIPASYSLSISGDFRVSTNNCDNPIPIYRGCSILLVFHPQKAGPQQGSLVLSFPGTSLQETVTLTGNTSSPGISISPNTLNFGLVDAKLTSAPQQLTLTNSQSFAVTVPAPILSGAGASQFLVTDNCSTIQPGTSCQASVVFAPTLNGNQAATLTFQNGGTPVTEIPVALAGLGNPVPGFSNHNIVPSFGSVPRGTSSAPVALNIWNDGPVAAPMPAFTVTGTNASEYVATAWPNCAMVAPNGVCTISIVFSPAGGETRSATLSFDSGATIPTTVVVALNGYGLDFTVTTSGASTQTISSGQSASYSVLMQTNETYSPTLTISCQAVGASYGPCTANPATVTVSNNQAVTAITISRAATSRLRRNIFPGWQIALGMLIAPLGVLLRRRSSRKAATALALLTFSLLGFVSCGGGGSGSSSSPQVQTYTYTVTATNPANNVSHSTTLTLVTSSQ